MQNIKATANETTKNTSGPISWVKKLIAILALINLVLGLFNLSYIPLRDAYLRHLPSVVIAYDPIKGIEPHPDTERYLHTVDELTAELHQPQTDLTTPNAERLLASLRDQSHTMLDENPFMVASKFGTFAKIQRRMRQHVGTEYAHQAFPQFWSADYLLTHDWNAELAFFDSSIRPLIATNYFRNVDDYGQFIDEFWRIDIFFICFFGIEFLLRTFFRYRRTPGLNWFDAMLRRWYDVFLFLPFWRGLRVIPVVVRLQQSGLVNFEKALVQMTYEPAAKLADRLSQFVMVRFINQAQESIQEGTAARALFYPKSYIDLNDVNEIEVITDRLLELTIYKVVPKIQPELEAVLHHSIEGAFKESTFYQTLQQVPGIGHLPAEAIEQLANNLADSTVTVLTNSYADVEGRALFENLTHEFTTAFRLAVRDRETLTELQSLLTDLLEEVKLNYVVKTTNSDPQATLAEVEQLDQAVEYNSLPSAPKL